MLIIREDQLTVFRQVWFDSLAASIAQSVQQKFPDLIDQQNPEKSTAQTSSALDRAWSYGLRQDVHLRTFGELALVCGRHFDFYPPFHELFTEPSSIEPDDRFESLFEVATEEDWACAGRYIPTPSSEN